MERVGGEHPRGDRHDLAEAVLVEKRRSEGQETGLDHAPAALAADGVVRGGRLVREGMVEVGQH